MMGVTKNRDTDQQLKNPDINYLFEPRAVAVIRASHNKAKIGYKIGKYPI
jgi:hypothetical protein